MTSPDSLLLDRGSYYAPIPMLAVDARGIICDFNVALRVLMHPDIEHARSRPVDQLTGDIADHIEGDLFPSGEWGNANPHLDPVLCRYQSPRFGWTELRRSGFRYLQPDGDGASGTLVFLEVLSAERPVELADAISAELRRLLTWESYAASYDRVLPLLPFYREVVGRHLQSLSAPDIKTVLDLGAGTGNVSVALVEAGREVTALDLSRAMLEKLRSKIPAGSRSRLVIQEQNAEHLPQWRDGTFDGVTVLLACYAMASPARAFREAVRLLRPGGQLVITEPKRSFQLEPLLAFVDQFLKQEGLYDELKNDWVRVNSANIELDPKKRDAPLRAEDIVEELESAAFKDIIIEDSHLGNCATIRARKPTCG